MLWKLYRRVNMKRHQLTMFIIALLLSILAVPTAHASEWPTTNANVENIVYLSDGGYMITVVTEEKEHASVFSATQTKSGSKTSTVYSATGNKLYSLTVHGTFSYNGTSATANSSSYSYSDESPLWNFSSASSYCSGATATASGTFKSSLTSKTLSVSLTCSASGTLS